MDAPSLFDRYWAAVSRLLDRDPQHKSAAIQVSSGGLPLREGIALVGDLMDSMQGPQWRQPASPSEGNWVWRDAESVPATASPEVRLERQVIAQGGLDGWSYQMSTASGLHGPASGRRRAIDLVHRGEDQRYEFIELKVNSDQPLYAAFEILGYGLAYLHARRHGQRGAGRHDVMSAKCIDLVVLGPADWYIHSRRGGDGTPFDMDRLATSINAGLAEVLRADPDQSPGEMSIRFERFRNASDTQAAAAEIVELFGAC